MKNFGSTSLPVKHSAKSCCGSQIEDFIEINRNLSRTVDCGSVFITDDWKTENYPPNTIRDLRIESFDSSERSVNLLWTSLGGDYTTNEVNRYEIKVFRANGSDSDLRNEIRSKFDSKSISEIDIKPISMAERYGEQQRARVIVKSVKEGIHYFAIKLFDKENHGSDVSNIVMAYIRSN